MTLHKKCKACIFHLIIFVLANLYSKDVGPWKLKWALKFQNLGAHLAPKIFNKVSPLDLSVWIACLLVVTDFLLSCWYEQQISAFAISAYYNFAWNISFPYHCQYENNMHYIFHTWRFYTFAWNMSFPYRMLAWRWSDCNSILSLSFSEAEASSMSFFNAVAGPCNMKNRSWQILFYIYMIFRHLLGYIK